MSYDVNEKNSVRQFPVTVELTKTSAANILFFDFLNFESLIVKYTKHLSFHTKDRFGTDLEYIFPRI